VNHRLPRRALPGTRARCPQPPRGAALATLLTTALLCPLASALGAAAEEAQPQPGRPLTTVAGTSLSYHVASTEDLEPSLRDLVPYFDIVWVDVPTWDKDVLHFPGEIERVTQTLDTAHRLGLKTAFCFPWASLLPREPQGEAEALFGSRLDPETGGLAPCHSWDYGSDAALAEFRARCRALFAAVGRPAEMLMVDEQILGEPGRDFWYRPISTYWTSPTYSSASLTSFRAFLARKGLAGAEEARFPVTTRSVEAGARANEGLPAVPITDQNRDRLVADDDWPAGELWQAWYEWRTELYARWLEAACDEATRYWDQGDGWLGCCYVVPDTWAVKELGQDLSLIAALPHVDFVSAGYNSGTHFDWFRHAASLVRKRWGTIVQLCTYGKREGTPPDTIRQTFRTAVEAGASLLHVYAGVNFFTRRKDPLDTGLYYMPEQVKAWQESVEWLRARPRP